MSHLSKAEEIEQQFDQLAQSGAYAQALDLVTRNAHYFPDYAQKVVYAWRITMACRLNDQALALQLLEEAVQAGYWYGELHTDPDYQLLHGLPEFERLTEICMERRAQAMAQAVPVIKTVLPHSHLSPFPLLLALHGGNSEVESFAGHWSAAVSHGWLVALPQSSQQYAPGAFTWNDWGWAIQEVQGRYAALCSNYAIDSQRIVLAGFSQGGGLAAWLALSGLIQVHGLILVGPFLPDVETVVPLMKAHPPQDMKAWLVAGQRDKFCLGVARRLAELLPQQGVPCELEVYADLEHNFPIDFERKLPQALDFVVQV